MVIGVLSVGVKSRVEVLWSMLLRLRLKIGIGSGFTLHIVSMQSLYTSSPGWSNARVYDLHRPNDIILLHNYKLIAHPQRSTEAPMKA